MAGSIVITTEDNHIQDYRHQNNGSLLPYNLKDIKAIWTDALFVLIVEKDTIFQRLLNDRIFKKMKVPFVLLTVSLKKMLYIIFKTNSNVNYFSRKDILILIHDGFSNVYGMNIRHQCLHWLMRILMGLRYFVLTNMDHS